MIKYDVRHGCPYDALAQAAAENKRVTFDAIKAQIIADCRKFDPTTITSSKSYISSLFIILLATRDYGTLHYYTNLCDLLQLFCPLDRLFITRLFDWLCGFELHACFKYTCLWLSQIHGGIDYPFADIIFTCVQNVSDNAFMQDLYSLGYPLHLQIYQPHVQRMLRNSVKTKAEMLNMLRSGCAPDLQTIFAWIKQDKNWDMIVEALALSPQYKMVDTQYTDASLVPFFLRYRAKIYWRKVRYFVTTIWQCTRDATVSQIDKPAVTLEQVEDAANTCDLAGNTIQDLHMMAPWTLWIDAKHILNLTEMSAIWTANARTDMINPYTRTKIQLAPIRQHLVNVKQQVGRGLFNYWFFFKEALENMLVCSKSRIGPCLSNPSSAECTCPYPLDLSDEETLHLYAQTDIWANISYPPDLDKFFDITHPLWATLAISLIQNIMNANHYYESMARVFYLYGTKLTTAVCVTTHINNRQLRTALLDYMFVLLHFDDGLQVNRGDWLTSALHQTFGFIHDDEVFLTYSISI